ncbi:MAG: serine/threonine protein kinase [Myxococcales bacterium]|nr:serine/threonine protein kinase [Myxococcales bacterium]
MARSGDEGGARGVDRRQRETVDAPCPDEDAFGSRSTDHQDLVSSGERHLVGLPSDGPAPEPRAVPSREAQRIGRFIVLGLLGEGGMGTVLRAYDETLARMVAVKLLRNNFGAARQQRLLREAQALAKLSHPNVVQVYEMGVVEGLMFIAMELVLGQTLHAWQQQPRPWTEVLDMYLQAGKGLAAAHAEGLIHRDFKPENCILGDDGRVRVLDFGLARARRLAPDESTATERAPLALAELAQSLERPLTRSGAVIGTLRYLPLPQLEGAPADLMSDQYSFCVSLYEGLYGTRPFADSSLSELLAAQRRGELQPVARGSAVPKRLRRVLLRGLAMHPEDRWPSIDALLDELERVRRPHRRWTRGVGVALLMGLGGAAWALQRPSEDPCRNPQAGLEGVWGPEDRAAVQAAFLGSGHPEAPRLLGPVRQQLDAYTRAWVDMAGQTCRATFVEHQQSEAMFDRRMICLHRRRSRLSNTIAALAEATNAQQVVDRTVLPFRLPSVEECADIDALMARLPPPSDPEVRAQVDRLRDRIDHAHTLREAGELARGLEVAESVVARARTVEYPPVLAEALECLGHLQAEAASGHKAETTLGEAIEVAARAKADEVLARAWALMLYALLTQGKLEEGIAVGRAAMAAATRVDDEITQGWVLNNLGALYGDNGDVARSLHHLRQALAVKERALGADHVDVGIAWSNLGNALFERGSYDGAKTAYERARSIFEATVGQSHPYAAYVFTGLGQIMQAQGEAGQAIELYRRALEIREAALGSEHVLIARSLRQLGEAELAERRLDAARLHLRRSLDTLEGLHGSYDFEVASALVTLAELELALERPEQAQAQAERALAIIERDLGSARERARVLFVLARSLWPDPSSRDRAHALAQQAHDAYAVEPQLDVTARAEVRAWLEHHPRGAER